VFPLQEIADMTMGEPRDKATPEQAPDAGRSEEPVGARRLRESDLRVILESTTDGILTVDDQGATITANRKFAEMWRIPKPLLDAADDDAMLAFVLDQLIDPDAFLNKVKALYGTTSLDMDTLFFKDGRVFDRYSAPLVQGGVAIGRVWSFRDVTERRQLEAERLKTQRLEAIGVLAGGIAHDFNNLLQGVFGYISMARRRIAPEDPAHELLGQAEKTLERSVGLTAQLLTFSKGGKPVRKRITLHTVIEDSARLALSGSRCDHRLTVMDDLWPVDADEGQLAQVIQNIVLNASEAMSEGGTVDVSAHNVELPPGGHPAFPEGGRFVRVVIRDTGAGMSGHDLARVFDPYFTTKQKGSGLGLATSYSIIRNHGGAIEAASRVGVGSTFTIHLPASDLPAVAPPPRRETALGRSARILVMDDEPAVREVVGDMLMVLGHEVKFAEDGGAAIEAYRLAREQETPFDLVILDLTIRCGMGGRETMTKLKEMDPGVVAVVSSGYCDDAIVAEYAAYGFRSFLPKPFDLEDLRAMLGSVLG
jgi:signal transduction histidine kinase/ActR/RegA family two-component response regulator